MNFLCNLKQLLSAPRKAVLPTSMRSCEELLSDLDHMCARLPQGEALFVTGDGEFTVRLTWKPQQKKPVKRMFSLDGHGRATEWIEPEGAGTKAVALKDAAMKPVKEETKKEEETSRESKQRRMMQRLSRYLKLHYAFRYNLLTERTECARLNTEELEDSHHLIYTPVDSRTLNGIALGAMEEGVDCWDRDIKRYVESDHVQAYHPFDLYFHNLPEWDGKDRVNELARRVSDKDVWVRSFHRWMLAVTAQWTGTGDRDRRANSVAPLLVSTTQGLGKSTFCRMLLPNELRDYFTESFDLTNASSAENKLASYGLINVSSI